MCDNGLKSVAGGLMCIITIVMGNYQGTPRRLYILCG